MPWDKANLTGMTALPFALNLLVPSALIGCWTAALIGGRLYLDRRSKFHFVPTLSIQGSLRSRALLRRLISLMIFSFVLITAFYCFVLSGGRHSRGDPRLV